MYIGNMTSFKIYPNIPEGFLKFYLLGLFVLTERTAIFFISQEDDASRPIKAHF